MPDPITLGIVLGASALLLNGCARKTENILPGIWSQDDFNGARSSISKGKIHLRSRNKIDAGVALYFHKPPKGGFPLNTEAHFQGEYTQTKK
ncbi:MAG: hypothetical protein AABZ57_03955 [Candidatus Margulisiibacteriota bacterium]